jgi:hypothetical protein
VVDRLRGTRAICTRPSPGLDISAAGAALVARSPVVHVDQLGWGVVREPTAGQLLSVDAGNPIPGFTPKGVGLFVPTVDELRRVYGAADSTTDLLARALAEGCDTVVATDGARAPG